MYRIRPYYKNNVSKDVFDLFDDFFSTSRTVVRDFRVDVKDLKDKYVVEAELPGLKKEDINIKFENDYLTISVNKEEENTEEDKKEKYIHKERTLFSSERRMYLPDVDPKKLGAKLNDGILEITLNKEEHAINSYMIDIK
jgi:HSP20 family protein